MVNVDILELFQEKDFLKVCAPMVRYSRLPFRILARMYGCDLCFTPMLMADSFVQSAKARSMKFSTCPDDSPLIVQFAANTITDFVNAAEMVVQMSDGVDLNCGCPQRWAMKEGYGANLLTKPETIRDMVLQVRNRVPQSFSVSVKIRLLNDTRHTVELARSLEAAGVTFLTLHARTVQERTSPIHADMLRDVSQSLQIPLVGNGDVKTLQGAERLHNMTKCRGIMAARGMLSNPAMFTGCDKTPLSCVQDWVNVSLDLRARFSCFHHHLVFMLEHTLPRDERRVFNSLRTTEAVLRFLEEFFGISYIPGSSGYSCVTGFEEETDREENSQGALFTSVVQEKGNEMEDEVLNCLGGLYAT